MIMCKQTLSIINIFLYIWFTTSIFNTYFNTRQLDWIINYEYFLSSTHTNMDFKNTLVPTLALAAIYGKNKACSGGNGGTTLQTKAC